MTGKVEFLAIPAMRSNWSRVGYVPVRTVCPLTWTMGRA